MGQAELSPIILQREPELLAELSATRSTPRASLPPPPRSCKHRAWPRGFKAKRRLDKLAPQRDTSPALRGGEKGTVPRLTASAGFLSLLFLLVVFLRVSRAGRGDRA